MCRKTWADINRDIRQWWNEEDIHEKRKNELEIFIALSELVMKTNYRYPKSKKLIPKHVKEEGIQEFFKEKFPKFDPNRAPLENYFNRLFPCVCVDITEKYVIRDKDGTPCLRILSIDDEGEDGRSSINNEASIQNFKTNEKSDIGYVLIMMILNMSNNLHGPANNTTRRNYYRLFFTNDVNFWLRDNKVDAEVLFEDYENELFQAMKESLMDYIYLEKCRSIQDIIEATIKHYGEVVEGREMKPIKQPLPNDVYTTYLYEIENIRGKDGGKLGGSTISTQRTAYDEFLKNNLKL